MSCAQCGTPLAPDQRYCLTCGARRGPLPPAVAAMIAGQSLPPAAPPTWAMADEEDDDGPLLSAFTPRIAAVATLMLLAAGVLIGALVGPTASSLARPAPVIVALSPQAATPAPEASTATPETPTAPDDSADTPAASSSDGGDSSSSGSADSSGGADSGSDTSGAADQSASSTAPDAGADLPEVRHLFLVVLSGQRYDDAFGGSSASPYLSKELPQQGELIPSYFAATQGELANGIALVSGQGPTVQTTADCPTPADIVPATIGDDGQVAGDGCLYPAKAQTIGDQLQADGRTWKAYVDGATTPCTVTPRNPFAYFHSLDGPACTTSDVGLDQLDADLKSATTTPTLSYIVPDACHDGSDAPCTPGAPAGMAAADTWLREVVGNIMDSAGYKDGGMIAITFDQAQQAGDKADASSCCTSAPFPNLPSGTTPSTTAPASTTAPSGAVPPSDAVPSTTDPASTTDPSATTPASTTTPAAGVLPDTGVSPGGGRVGLLLLSQFVKAGTKQTVGSYNHFSLLRSMEDLFGLDHLGYAADPAILAFDKAVYNNAKSS